MPPFYRLIGLTLIVVAAASCAAGTGDITPSTPPPGNSVPTTVDPLQESAGSLQASLADVSLVMAGSDMPDARLAWSDLESDLTSAIGDLVRDSESVDIDGLRGRLVSFENQYQLEAEPAWLGFMSMFDDFADNLEKPG